MAVTIRRAAHDDLDDLLALRAEVASEGVWIGAELPLDEEGDRARFAATIAADPSEAASLLAQVTAQAPVRDITIEEPAIDDIVRRIYAGSTSAATA